VPRGQRPALRRPTGYPAAAGDASWPRSCVFPKVSTPAPCCAPPNQRINRHSCRTGALVLFIVAMIALTVYAAFRLVREGAPKEIVFSARPDRPCAFGYGMAVVPIPSRPTRGGARGS